MTLLALDGEAGIALAREFEPKGVLLDLQLPRMDGWSVLQALKADLQTRHIPVHIISVEERTPRGLNMGAIGHLTKPVQPEDITQALALIASYSNRSEKWVLLVEDDERVRLDTARAIGNDTVSIKEVSTGAEALEALGQRDFDLIVLDLGLPDMRGVEMLGAAVAQDRTAARDREYGQRTQRRAGDEAQGIFRVDHRQGRSLARTPDR